MNRLVEAIEAAVEEAAADTGLSGDVVFYDVAVSVLYDWPDEREALDYAAANGIALRRPAKLLSVPPRRPLSDEARARIAARRGERSQHAGLAEKALSTVR